MHRWQTDSARPGKPLSPSPPAFTPDLTLLMLFSGLAVVSAFTAVIAYVNNIGPGLELPSLLVLFTPQFWRR